MKLCELKNNLLRDLSNFNGDFGVVIYFGNLIRFIYGDWEFLIFNNYPDLQFSYKIRDRNDVTHENFTGKVIFSRS